MMTAGGFGGVDLGQAHRARAPAGDAKRKPRLAAGQKRKVVNLSGVRSGCADGYDAPRLERIREIHECAAARRRARPPDIRTSSAVATIAASTKLNEDRKVS